MLESVNPMVSDDRDPSNQLNGTVSASTRRGRVGALSPRGPHTLAFAHPPFTERRAATLAHHRSSRLGWQDVDFDASTLSVRQALAQWWRQCRQKAAGPSNGEIFGNASPPHGSAALRGGNFASYLRRIARNGALYGARCTSWSRSRPEAIALSACRTSCSRR
jgi:hypothetical protein